MKGRKLVRASLMPRLCRLSLRERAFFRGAKDDTETSTMFGEPFDPKGELLIYEHCRPHWSQAGAMVFITFRTHDSIPREVIERWDQEKQEWLRQHGKDTGGTLVCNRPDAIRAG